MHADDAQHVPLARFRTNLKQILTHATLGAHGAKIILVTVSPLYEPNYINDTVPGDPRRTAANAAAYALASREVAGECPGVIVCDLWSAMMRVAGWEGELGGDNQALPGGPDAGENEALARMLPDGLHLSAEGYKVWYDELSKVIREQAPEILPENLKGNEPL